jgi:hypothetical protein
LIRALVVAGQVFERLLFGAPLVEVLEDDGRAVHVLRRVGAVDGHDPVAFGDRKAAQQRAVDDAPHGGGEADPERQRDDRDASESGMLGYHPESVLQIGEEREHCRGDSDARGPVWRTAPDRIRFHA